MSVCGAILFYIRAVQKPLGYFVSSGLLFFALILCFRPSRNCPKAIIYQRQSFWGSPFFHVPQLFGFAPDPVGFKTMTSSSSYFSSFPLLADPSTLRIVISFVIGTIFAAIRA